MVLLEARSQDVEAIFVAASFSADINTNTNKIIKKKKSMFFFLLHVLSSLYSAHCASLEIMFNYCVVIEMCYFLTTQRPICLSIICLTYILYFLIVGWGKSIYKYLTVDFQPEKKNKTQCFI